MGVIFCNYLQHYCSICLGLLKIWDCLFLRDSLVTLNSSMKSVFGTVLQERSALHI